MSNANPDRVLVTVEGVTVEKSVDTEQFETLAVIFDISVDPDGSGRIQLQEEIPDGVPLDDVGFHPDYGAEYWSIEENTVIFEREFEAGEDYTTIYGVREVGEEDSELFMYEPEMDVLERDRESPEGEPHRAATAEVGGSGNGDTESEEDGMEAVEGIVSKESSDLVRDVISGEADGMPGMEDDDAAPPASADPPVAEGGDADSDEEAAPVEPTDETDAPEPEAEPDEPEDALEAEGEGAVSEAAIEQADDAVSEAPVDDTSEEMREPEIEDTSDDMSEEPPADEPDEESVETAESTEDTREVTVPVTGGVARVLAKELREGTLREEDQAVLREELIKQEETTDARIKHLQQRVSDLEAYSEALEAFLQEEGPAHELLDDVSAEMDSMRDEMQMVQAETDSLSENLETVQTEVGSLRSTLDTEIADLRDDVSELAESIEEVDTGISSVKDDVARMSSEIDEVETDVQDIETDLASVESRVDAGGNRIEELAETVNALEDDLAAVRTESDQMASIEHQLEEFEADLAEVQNDLSEMASFRDRLMTALGQGMGGGEGGQSDADGSQDSENGE